MKSGPLSDAKVIAKINEMFVPLEINITDDGFPTEIAALGLWKKAYDGKPGHKSAFATTVITDPKGAYSLGTSGSGYLGDYDKATNYHSDKYLTFLEESLERSRRAHEIETSKTLSAAQREAKRKKLAADILQQVKKANDGER